MPSQASTAQLPQLPPRSSSSASQGPSNAKFLMGYHQTSWEKGESILKSGFLNLDRIKDKTAMLGPGVYFATNPQDTCGKAQHGQPRAMMLECYVFVGDMQEVGSKHEFSHACGSDTVFFGGFNGRPEFVVKDSRRICIICGYECDPTSGHRSGHLDEAARWSRLQWAQTAWKDIQLHGELSVDLRAERAHSALERISDRGKSKKKDRKCINRLFEEFAGSKGFLNRAELYALLCAIGQPPQNNKKDLQATFDEFDRNGNGKVTKAEFRREMVYRAKHDDFDFDSDA